MQAAAWAVAKGVAAMEEAQVGAATGRVAAAVVAWVKVAEEEVATAAVRERQPCSPRLLPPCSPLQSQSGSQLQQTEHPASR